MNDYKPVREPESPAEMGSMSADDTARLIAQRNESSARTTLIESLIFMGRFEEVLLITEDEDQKKWIVKLIKAEAREDDHRCGCKFSIDTTDYARLELYPPEEREKRKESTESPNYLRIYRHWSSKYNQMVSFYKCQVCGCIQTLPDSVQIDDLHASHYDNRRSAVDDALKQGFKFRRL